jgi:hypothetical protein
MANELRRGPRVTGRGIRDLTSPEVTKHARLGVVVTLVALVLAVTLVATVPAAESPSAPPISHFRFFTGPTISAFPLQGPVGAAFNVTGSGFSISSPVNVTFENGTTGSQLLAPVGGSNCANIVGTTFDSNASGNFSCAFTVPSVIAGWYNISANDTMSATFSNVVVFEVTVPEISVAPAQGPVGATVAVEGTGFSVYPAAATLNFDTVPVSSCGEGGSLESSTGGAFSCSFAVPSGTSGSTVVATDAGGQTADGAFLVTTPAITVAPAQGPIGAHVTVSGTGFTVSTPLASLEFDSVSITGCGVSGSLTADSTGAFACEFAVPSGTSGTAVVATDAGGQAADSIFTVTTPAISAAPAQGPVGAGVTVAGSGFTVSAPLSSLNFDGLPWSSCSTGSLTTSSTGTFSCSFSVPSGTSTSTVRANDAGGESATATFTVTVLSIIATPAHGPIGSPVTISGTGFSVSTSLASLTFLGISVVSCSGGGSLTTSGTGTFACTFPVPSGTSGSTVRATDAGGQSATTSFSVTTEVISLSVYQGPVGALFVVAGMGFTADAGATVAFGSPPPLTPTSCSDGSSVGSTITTTGGGGFSCSFDAPSDLPGMYSVVATDVTTTATSNSITFVVTVPAITLSPGQGPVGALFGVAGSGFSVNSGAAVTFSGSSLSPTSCSSGTFVGTAITTTDSGTFACTFSVPAEGPANFNVGANDVATSTPTSTISFTVTAISIVVAPDQGPVGTTVDVAGTGFSVSSALAALVFDSVAISSCASGSLATSVTGTFGCSFPVPTGSSGTTVAATDPGGQVASAQFLVTIPSVSVTPGQGAVGSEFTLIGAGFQAMTPLTISAAGVDLTPTSCSSGSFSGTTVTTGATGGFTCTFLLSSQPGGTVTLVATQGANAASASFVVSPSFTISTGSAAVGTVISFAGSGFLASTAYTVQWNSSTTLCSGTTSASGELTCSSAVPAAPAGAHTITIDQGSTSISSSFSVIPSISVTPSTGPVGTSVTLTGSGFDAGTSFVVTWQGGATLCSGTTDSNGGFSCTFTVPSSSAGTATISVSEGSYTPSYSFTVTASPPGPAGPAPFPWWAVAVVALVAVGLLVLGLVYEHRRHHRSRHPGSGPSSFSAPAPWEESNVPPVGATAPTPPPGPAAGPGGVAGLAAPDAGTDTEDIDALIARLERMSVQMFHKTPKQLGDPYGSDSSTSSEK